MTSKIFVSIAMCTYNGERFLREQLDSILNQTYENFELVITDDGSQDGTIKLIKEYQKQDSRIKLFQNETNLGFVKNFEKAISLCKGDYIALADQDDIWKNNKLEVFLDEIKENILIYSDAILIDALSQLTGRCLITPTNKLVNGKCNKAFLLSNCVSGNTLMFKKELVEYILPIPEKFSFHDLWIAFVASTIGTIDYTEEPLTYYRRYDEQVTRSQKRVYTSFMDRLQQKNESKLRMAKIKIIELQSFLSLSHLLDEEIKVIINSLLEHYKSYQSLYFDISLYKLLYTYKNEIFAIYTKKNQMKRVRRTASGLKLDRLLLHSM